jgi:hypothetical protein
MSSKLHVILILLGVLGSIHAAETEPLETMQGDDLAPLNIQEIPQNCWTDFFYEHPTISKIERIPTSEALVTPTCKYFYWPDFGHEQLFHLTNDPREQNDLTQNSEYNGKLEVMRARFNELKKAAR